MCYCGCLVPIRSNFFHRFFRKSIEVMEECSEVCISLLYASNFHSLFLSLHKFKHKLNLSTLHLEVFFEPLLNFLDLVMEIAHLSMEFSPCSNSLQEVADHITSLILGEVCHAWHGNHAIFDVSSCSLICCWPLLHHLFVQNILSSDHYPVHSQKVSRIVNSSSPLFLLSPESNMSHNDLKPFVREGYVFPSLLDIRQDLML